MKPRLWSLVRLALPLAAPALLSGCAGLAYSPDGKTLAFSWQLKDKPIVALIGVDGTDFRYVAGTNGKGPIAWSPDGRQLLATEFGADGEARELIAVDVESGRVRRVSGKAGIHAAWTDSPSRIVFYEPGERAGSGAYVWYDLSTGKETLRVGLEGTNPEETIPLQWLSASDGVAFVGKDANVYVLWRGEKQRVTSTGDVIGLQADRTGRNLYWARRSRNPRYILLSLYAYRLSDRTVRKLDFPDRIAAINPTPRSAVTKVPYVRFSPDLKSLLAVTEEEGAKAGDVVRSVYRMDLDGANARRIARFIGNDAIPGALAWSPAESEAAILELNETNVRLVLHPASGAARVLRTVSTAKPPK